MHAKTIVHEPIYHRPVRKLVESSRYFRAIIIYYHLSEKFEIFVFRFVILSLKLSVTYNLYYEENPPILYSKINSVVFLFVKD